MEVWEEVHLPKNQMGFLASGSLCTTKCFGGNYQVQSKICGQRFYAKGGHRFQRKFHADRKIHFTSDYDLHFFKACMGPLWFSILW